MAHRLHAWPFLLMATLGCGETNLVLDAALGDGGTDTTGPERDLTAPDAGSPDAPADLAIDVAPDADSPWLAPATCDGLRINGGTPFAVFDATGVPSSVGPGPTCEGDGPYTVQVNRVLCGSIPAMPTAIANALGPNFTLPLMPGQRALLSVTIYACPRYTTRVYDVSDRREIGAWSELAAMLRADGGP
jgi:hypothetical protein